MLGLAALGVVGVLVLVIVVLPALLVGPDAELTAPEKLKAENDVRTTVLQALVGAVLLTGLYFTGRTYLLNRESQVTERFTRAIDQVGNCDSLDVRLGGIYGLERIAQESQRDHWPIMEILTAFVREHTREAQSEWEAEHGERSRPGYSQPAAADVQAALAVFGRRTREYEGKGQRLSLERCNLREARLEGAYLRDAQLKGADLSGAHLEGADLRAVDLEYALLHGVHFEQADLRESNLKGSPLRAAHLAGADLRMAHLEGADLIEADLTGADLRATRLEGADLREAHLDWADLQEAHLERADLRASSVTEEQIKTAFLDESTQLPSYLKV